MSDHISMNPLKSMSIENEYTHVTDEISTGGDDWGFEEHDNISKFCSVVNEENMCVCTNEVSRDVYRC